MSQDYLEGVAGRRSGVWVTISAFGIDGPRGRVPGSDLVCAAAGGLLGSVRDAEGGVYPVPGFPALRVAGQIGGSPRCTVFPSGGGASIRSTWMCLHRKRWPSALCSRSVRICSTNAPGREAQGGILHRQGPFHAATANCRFLFSTIISGYACQRSSVERTGRSPTRRTGPGLKTLS